MAMSKLPGEQDDSGDGVFADINITPLTDIFLVLLIIFMVTSSAIVASNNGASSSGVQVNLPKGGATDVHAQQSDLSVAVLEDGRTVIGGKVMTAEELKVAFQQAQSKNPETMVIVQADSGVPHGKVVDVMELAKGAGLAHLAIATRSE